MFQKVEVLLVNASIVLRDKFTYILEPINMAETVNIVSHYAVSFVCSGFDVSDQILMVIYVVIIFVCALCFISNYIYHILFQTTYIYHRTPCKYWF